jgi:hypothetical protein
MPEGFNSVVVDKVIAEELACSFAAITRDFAFPPAQADILAWIQEYGVRNEGLMKHLLDKLGEFVGVDPKEAPSA